MNEFIKLAENINLNIAQIWKSIFNFRVTQSEAITITQCIKVQIEIACKLIKFEIKLIYWQ